MSLYQQIIEKLRGQVDELRERARQLRSIGDNETAKRCEDEVYAIQHRMKLAKELDIK